jgi:uncharacterized protein
MTLTEEHANRPIISSYTDGKISIGENAYQTSLLITPAGKVSTWSVEKLDQLTEKNCLEIIAYKPEIVIIGTGTTHQLPSLSIIHYFTNHQIGIEIMSTSAACRTYNVLALEDRNVLAALIIS